MILHIRIFEWNRRVSPTPESFWCCRIFVPGNCVGWFKIGSWTRFAVVWVCTSFWFVSSHATMHLLFVHQLLQILIHFQKMVHYPKWLFPFTHPRWLYHLSPTKDIESAVSCCTIATRLDLLSTFAQQRGFLVGRTVRSRLGWWRSAGRQVGGTRVSVESHGERSWIRLVTVTFPRGEGVHPTNLRWELTKKTRTNEANDC